ncbi:uncharacterized protein YALI1_E28405g [Yarrowia lipolytica]|uniref:Secreted protein n=1 Tax=Yarrowia lipolytica TaxID=4952 RepID=A0A1D8NJR9_YARLL|nr:hypothetical protein YALI1_E28405g [Yarrowia lipolytica]
MYRCPGFPSVLLSVCWPIFLPISVEEISASKPGYYFCGTVITGPQNHKNHKNHKNGYVRFIRGIFRWWLVLIRGVIYDGW